MDKLLTTEEVARLTRAPVATVRYWVHVGTAPASFKLGRRRVFREGDVLAWIAAQEAAMRRPPAA